MQDNDKKPHPKKNAIIIVSPVLDSVNFLNDYIEKNKNIHDFIILHDKNETIGYFNNINNIIIRDIRFTRKFFSFSSISKLIKNIKEINSNYTKINVILNSPNSILYLLFFKYFLSNKKIYIIIHGLLEARPLFIRIIYNFILNIFIPFSYKTICVNKSYKFLSKRKIYYLEYIGFGIISERYFAINNLRSIRRKNKKIKIGFVGRYTKEKGIDRYINLKNILNKSCLKHEFIFYSYGDKINITNEIISHKILYNKKDIAAFYSSIDILIFPSRGDSVGLAQLEALCSGAIILSSNNNGSKQLKKIFNNQIFIINNWDEKTILYNIEKIINNIETLSKSLIEFNQSNYVIKYWDKIFE